MEKHELEHIHRALTDRRGKLVDAMIELPDSAQFQALLDEVDAALGKLSTGCFGVCESCEGEVENERLSADPLLRFCLDCLSSEQQRELEHDLTLASSIQSALLPPRELQIDGWHIAYHYQPAGLVSGDYCDLIPFHRPGEKALFLLGDVSGKGVAASMLMTHLHAMFHSLAGLGLELNELFERVNRQLCESTASTQYSTLAGGILDQDGSISLCNAGHCPPVLVQDGNANTLHATGLPLGLFCSGTYKVRQEQMKPGDSLILYSDGLNETLQGDDEYGIDRVHTIASANHSLAPDQLIRTYLRDLKDFSRSDRLQDDLTIMVIQRG